MKRALITVLALCIAGSVHARFDNTYPSWDALYQEALKHIPPKIVLELDDEAADRLRAFGLPPASLEAYLPSADYEPVFLVPPKAESAQLWRDLGMHRWFVLQPGRPLDPAEALPRLERLPAVSSARTSALYLSLLNPADAEVYNMWGVQQMALEAAWDMQVGDDQVVVSTLDTGVDVGHPDLRGNLRINPGEDLNANGSWDASDMNGIDDDGNGFVDDLAGWDFVNQTPPGFLQVNGEDYAPRDRAIWPDIVGHGTHVAGTSASVTNNSYGVPSPSWNVSNMPLRFGYAIRLFFLILGSGNDLDMAQALQYAVDNGSDIVSISFGGNQESDVFALAAQYAHAQGVTVFAAAGNSDTDAPSYPAATEHVIAVAATDVGDARASFSNYGTWVDLAAPGVNIWSTVPRNQGAYDHYDGTSMACPNAAGVAALVLSHNPAMTAADLETFMIEGCDNIDDVNPGFEGLLGAGRINAASSLSLARASYAAPDFANLDIVPLGPPTVPGNGANLAYNVTVSNQSAGDLTAFDAWTSVLLPNGNSLPGPFSLFGITVVQGQTLMAPLILSVPDFAPAGNYRFAMSLGYDNAAAEEAAFVFSKTAQPAGAPVETWASEGRLPSATTAALSDPAVPTDFRVASVYPNPFNGHATVDVELPERATLTVELVDVLGRRVRTLASGDFQAGRHSIAIAAGEMGSGVYFLRVNQKNGESRLRKVVLLK